MTNPFAFKTLRPAFVDEDYSETVTIDGTGSISDWSFGADVLDAGGASAFTPTVTILDADARTVSVAITGEDLEQGDYTITLYRINTGARTLICQSVLEVQNPAAPNAWGA